VRTGATSKVPAGSVREGTADGGRPRRAVRIAVYAFLVAIVLCGALEIEAWPLSAFRLFSTVRTGTQVRWELAAVDDAGLETPADVAAMGRGFRQSVHLLPTLAAASAAEQDQACEDWLEADRGARRMHVYRSVYVAEQPGAPSVLQSRAQQFVCERP